ncbi:cupredoxin domain-containing protein [Candidatus Uhrbacteria bacterium]|nr:cupredoxin domain-containing protein [Candidatus Uhrbacteria bacterium]
MRRFWVVAGSVLMAMLFVASLVRAGQKLVSGGMGVRTVEASSVPLVTIAPDGVQRVTLSFGSFNYTPDVIHVKRGIPVEIVADLDRLKGCFTSFSVPDINVWGQFTAAKDRIAFTPDRAGTFRFSCAMGMGSGKLVVEA